MTVTTIDDTFAEQDAKLRARCEAVRRLLAEAREDTRRTQRELDDAAKAQRQSPPPTMLVPRDASMSPFQTRTLKIGRGAPIY